MSGKEAQLMQLLQPTIEAMGYSVVGYRVDLPGRRPTFGYILMPRRGER